MPEAFGDALVKALDSRIARRKESRVEISGDRWAFRQAAAVLTAFHLPSLRPYPPETDPSAAGPIVLLDDVVPAPGWRAEQLHMLKAEVRREALARLGTRARMIEALAANPQRRRDAPQSGRRRPV